MPTNCFPQYFSGLPFETVLQAMLCFGAMLSILLYLFKKTIHALAPKPTTSFSLESETINILNTDPNELGANYFRKNSIFTKTLVIVIIIILITTPIDTFLRVSNFISSY